MYELYEHEPYDQGEQFEESAYPRARSQPREDIWSSSRRLDNPSGWVFISRQADIVIVLILVLICGLGIMWFISTLPSFLETASAHFDWAKGFYATWGTPSMRWLFINLVVGVIVATSGLLSTFGGDNGGQEADRSGFDNGRVLLEASHSSSSYNASETEYKSPVYNPYIEPINKVLHHQASFGAWNYVDNEQALESEGGGEGDGEGESEASQAHVDESSATPGTPAGVMSREMPHPGSSPEPGFSGGNNGVGQREPEEVEIESTVHDPELTESTLDHGVTAETSIHGAPDGGSPPESSPHEPEVLGKSHNFTIGRVIRRDQLLDFMDPVSGHLTGIGRNLRLDPQRGFRADSVSEAGQLPGPPIEVSSSPDPELQTAAPAPLEEPVTPRFGNSAESVPAVVHHRRLSSDSAEASIVPPPKQVSAPGEVMHPSPADVKQPSPPPPSPLLKQQLTVDLQASSPAEDTSPPPSPPMEDPIPPPPLPPHLELPPALQDSSSSIISSEELPSFRFHVPPPPEPTPAMESFAKPPQQVSSTQDKKPSPVEHPMTPSKSFPVTVDAETGSSSAQEEGSATVNPHRSPAGEKEIQEGSGSDRQESSSPKNDDLHEQIEDFLARFHENWRLQRQESLARYKKRLVELDE